MARYIRRRPAKIRVDVDLGKYTQPETHGYAEKDMIVLHETVSPDYAGLSDIIQTSAYLQRAGYGVHGVIDADGNLGWAIGERQAVLYHTASNGSKGNGHVNTRAIGIELISRVMLDYPDQKRRFEWWWNRNKQINKLAQIVAFQARVEGVPLRYSDGSRPGVTTHWQVTRTFGVYGGHVDCYPKHLGGYFPVLRVIGEARRYYQKWWGVAV